MSGFRAGGRGRHRAPTAVAARARALVRALRRSVLSRTRTNVASFRPPPVPSAPGSRSCRRPSCTISAMGPLVKPRGVAAGAGLRSRTGSTTRSSPTPPCSPPSSPTSHARLDETGRAVSAGLGTRAATHGARACPRPGWGRGGFAAVLARTYPTVESSSSISLPWRVKPSAPRSRRSRRRVKVRAADFLADPLDPTGAGFDLVLLSRVLMGLDDRAAVALIERVAATLRPGGRVAVHELPADGGRGGPRRRAPRPRLLLITGGAVRRARGARGDPRARRASALRIGAWGRSACWSRQRDERATRGTRRVDHGRRRGLGRAIALAYADAARTCS